MVYHNICPTCICKGRTQQHSKKKYFVIHVKHMYILIAQGFYWAILKLLYLMETASADFVWTIFFH